MSTQMDPAPETHLGPGPDDVPARQSMSRHAPSLILAATCTLVGLLLYLSGWMNVVAAVVLAWLAYGVLRTTVAGVTKGRRNATDVLATYLVSSAFALAILPLTSLMWVVIKHGAPAFSASFFTYSMRSVVGAGGGIYHAIIGTLFITAAAAMISIPIGLLTAVYLVEYGKRGALTKAVTFLVDVMTGIPSIVAGLVAYALFVLFFGEGTRSGLAGAVALSVLMVPIVVRSSEEMLKLVPDELREGAYALGVRKWRTVVKIVLRTAAPGIVTGIMLAVARVVGETAPLLVTAGFTDTTNFNLFSQQMMTLPVFAYQSFKSPGVPPGPGYERAWGAALVLLIIVMVLNLVARLFTYYFSPKVKR
jgi:phosphate transport system permease protein